MNGTERAPWARVKQWGRDVDGLLRSAFAPKEEAAAVAARVASERLVWLCLILGGSYGAFMGIYSLVRGGENAHLQVISSAVKVPLLFLLTLLVTFPSLYVFSALSRSGLTFTRTLRALVLAIALDLAVLASLGPVTAFFAVSTDNYSFIVLLNVFFFVVAGTIGMVVLWRGVRSMFGENQDRRTMSRTRRVFSTWCVIFGVVGAQMSWLLRPFIGKPELPFELLRPTESSFFAGFIDVVRDLFVP